MLVAVAVEMVAVAGAAAVVEHGVMADEAVVVGGARKASPQLNDVRRGQGRKANLCL